jgi:hypothetical protein
MMVDTIKAISGCGIIGYTILFGRYISRGFPALQQSSKQHPTTTHSCCCCWGIVGNKLNSSISSCALVKTDAQRNVVLKSTNFFGDKNNHNEATSMITRMMGGLIHFATQKKKCD